jgi:hypothetical protein
VHGFQVLNHVILVEISRKVRQFGPRPLGRRHASGFHSVSWCSASRIYTPNCTKFPANFGLTVAAAPTAVAASRLVAIVEQLEADLLFQVEWANESWDGASRFIDY